MGGGKHTEKRKKERKKEIKTTPPPPPLLIQKPLRSKFHPEASVQRRLASIPTVRRDPHRKNKQTNPKRHSAFLLPLLVLHLTSVRCRKHPCPSPPSLPGGGSPPSQQTERLTKRISIPHRWRRSPDRLEEGKKQTGLSGSMARLRIQEPQQQLKKNK